MQANTDTEKGPFCIADSFSYPYLVKKPKRIRKISNLLLRFSKRFANVRKMFEQQQNLLPPPDAEFEVDDGQDPMVG